MGTQYILFRFLYDFCSSSPTPLLLLGVLALKSILLSPTPRPAVVNGAGSYRKAINDPFYLQINPSYFIIYPRA
jgi:hypothetical protein